jgi:hypothetical protein
MLLSCAPRILTMTSSSFIANGRPVWIREKGRMLANTGPAAQRLTDLPKYIYEQQSYMLPLKYLRRVSVRWRPPSSRAGTSLVEATLQRTYNLPARFAEIPLRKRGMVLRYDMWCWTSESSALSPPPPWILWRSWNLSPLRVFGSGVLAGLSWTPKWMGMKAGCKVPVDGFTKSLKCLAHRQSLECAVYMSKD